LQNYLSDVLPFSVAVISVSHIGEWVPAATEKIVFFFFSKRRRKISQDIEDIRIWTSDYWSR